MATYSYVCEKCNKVFDIEKSIKEYNKDDKEDCVNCKNKCSRYYGNVNVNFNWVGNWYSNKKTY